METSSLTEDWITAGTVHTIRARTISGSLVNTCCARGFEIKWSATRQKERSHLKIRKHASDWVVKCRQHRITFWLKVSISLLIWRSMLARMWIMKLISNGLPLVGWCRPIDYGFAQSRREVVNSSGGLPSTMRFWQPHT